MFSVILQIYKFKKFDSLGRKTHSKFVSEIGPQLHNVAHEFNIFLSLWIYFDLLHGVVHVTSDLVSLHALLASQWIALIRTHTILLSHSNYLIQSLNYVYYHVIPYEQGLPSGFSFVHDTQLAWCREYSLLITDCTLLRAEGCQYHYAISSFQWSKATQTAGYSHWSVLKALMQYFLRASAPFTALYVLRDLLPLFLPPCN